MNIKLNGSEHETTANTLAELVTELDLAGKRFAVEMNEALVPKSQHDCTELTDGDIVEVVRAVGGG